MTKRIRYIIFFVAIAVISAVARLLPHQPNITPMGALFMFAGIYGKKMYNVFLPLLAMVISDSLIGFYDIKILLVVYFSFVCMYTIGWWFKSSSSYALIQASLLGSLLFFLTTNFAVWTFGHWYLKNLSGLGLCYVLAVPFFRNSLLGDVVYLLGFSLAYRLIVNYEDVLCTIKKLLFIYIPFYGSKTPNS